MFELKVKEAESDLAEDDAKKESVEVLVHPENFSYQIEDIVESSLGRYDQGRHVGQQECVEE